MLSKRIKLFLYLPLPLLGGGTTFGILQLVGGDHIANGELQSIIAIISLLVAIAVSIIPRHLILAELQNGIAQLDDGNIQFSDELSARSLLGGRVESWIPYSQPIHTTICIAGPHDWRYIDVIIERHISRSHEGKIIAAHIDEIYPILEERLQHLIFATSREDHSFADFFAANQLMNDEDINTFKSKLLSTIKLDKIPGIEYGLDPSTIIVDKNSVRQVERHFIDNHERTYSLVDLDLDHILEQSDIDAAKNGLKDSPLFEHDFNA
ncbi:MAG: hypothetical protein GQ470_05205 [Gammaproteobacteria bacterium]|nr:hypothetical protein [Gammaproteobacteria bacterium]